MNQTDRDFFTQHGFLNLGKILSDEEVAYFLRLFDQDRQQYHYFWHRYSHHQYVNYDALITTETFDELIRHPAIYPKMVALMGGPLCFGEIGLRYMGPYHGHFHQSWHRDKPHWPEHSLQMDYIQLMVYLTDVDESTHCISFSPEAVGQPILADKEAQLARRGVYDLHGPAGTCAIFNVSVLHTATTRPTQAERKTVQIYYGHRERAPLANDSGIPVRLWRDHPDEETRAFYGVLNERTRLYMAAFGP